MLRDARFYQIGFLSIFLGFGVWGRDWSLQPQGAMMAIAACLLVQVLLVLLLPPPPQSQIPRWRYAFKSLPSAAITSLSLCLLLRANHPLTMALAGGAAIASKFWLKSPQSKHFFNPANFGIMTALMFTRDAWVSPGQWGTEWWAVLLFACLGGTIAGRVGRWDTSAPFLGTFALLEIGRNAWLGWGWDVALHHLTSGSLLLFAFFMLTDPRSIPNARPARMIWAVSIALLTFGLRYALFVPAAMFWALFILSPTTLWLDRIWPEQRFQWGNSAEVSAEPRQAWLALPQARL